MSILSKDEWEEIWNFKRSIPIKDEWPKLTSIPTLSFKKSVFAEESSCLSKMFGSASHPLLVNSSFNFLLKSSRERVVTSILVRIFSISFFKVNLLFRTSAKRYD
jgi:hypothetical protein